MPLSIVSTEPESSSASQLSVVSSKPVPKVTSADIERIAKQYDVPADLAVGVAHIESANDPLAKSNKGAQGVMQLMPGTASRYGVTDPYDPEQNITGGVKYLKDLLKQFNGDRDKALAAYNWGEKHVADGKEVPSSVQKYVSDVSAKAKEHAWSNLKVVSTEPESDSGGRNKFMAVSEPKGLIEQGNLSIWDRPTVKNSDGSHSSEYSISQWDDRTNAEVLIPTVVNGKFLTPDGKKPPEGSAAEKAMFKEAWQHYLKTGENLGKFKDADDADVYAKALHERGEQKQSDKKPLSIVSTVPEHQSLPGQEKPMAGAPQDWAKQALTQSGVTAPVAGPAAPPPVPARAGYITGAPVPETPDFNAMAKQQTEGAKELFDKPLIPHADEMVAEHKKLAESVDAKKHPVLAWLADADVVGVQTLAGLSTPGNVALLGLMAALPEEAAIKKLIDAGFSFSMAKSAYQQFKSAWDAHKGGDDREARRQAAGGALSTLFSGLAAHGAVKDKIIGSKEEPVVAETDATVGKQLDALKAGTVSTVMIPQGGKVPAVPEGMQSVTVDKGKGAGTYIFDPRKVSAETVRQAAESGKHGELLGHVQSKAEVADKPKVVVQARAEDGTPVQESVVENKPEVVAAQTKVLEDRHPEAEVTVTTPQEVVGERAGVPVEKPEAAGEGKETKYSYGSTQADIPEDSEAAHALTAARQRISDADLAGKGRDVGGNHVTVRYGIDSDDTAGVREFLSQQKPFYATLGKTEKFEPSKSSDGAAVINAPIEAPELHRINDELENHGDFIEPTFDEYKPHATVAYVKPEAADRYVGMDVTSGKKFLIDRVAITNRNGDQVIVPLEGKEPGTEAKQPTTNKTEPASIIKVPLGSLVLDPNRFQYKLNVDEKGVSNILKGRKWNPDLAGVVSVWQDPHDEELYVVNGHHRVDLARDNGVQNLDVRVINAPDAATARTVGALQNIAEGRGTAVDAAKFLRDTGRDVNDLEREGITLTEKKAADGVALAKLADPIFQEVATGKMRIGRGVAIGSATDDPAQQEAILKMIEKREKSGKAIPDAVVAELGRMAKGAKDKTETQDTLFGVQSMTRNLLLEKAEVSEYIRKQIGSEKKLFSGVSTESTAQRLGKAGNVIDAEENAKIATQAAQAQELYDRFSVKTGEINDILNRAADELANGESPNAVKQRAYEEVRKTLAETLGKPVEGGAEGVQAGPRTGEAEAHAEPAAGVKQGAVEGPLTETKLRAELAKHPNITPEQRDAMVTVWKQFSEKYLGMDFDQFLNQHWKDLKVGGEYAGEAGLQQRGAVTWAYHPQKGILTDRAGRKGHEQLLHEAGVDYMGGRAYDKMPRGRATVDPYTRSVVVSLQGDSDLTPAAERELRHALDVPDDYTVRTNHSAPLFQKDSSPAWYSKLARIVGDSPVKSSASGEQWMRMLQNKGVKLAEIEATGLDEFLKGKSKVSRDEVSEFVKANQVQVKEVTKGGMGPRPTLDDQHAIMEWASKNMPDQHDRIENITNKIRYSGDLQKVGDLEMLGIPDDLLEPFRNYAGGEGGPKFSTYVLPGGENYRELLLTLPEKVGEVKWEDSGPTKLNLERPGGGYSVVDTRQWTADVNGAEYRITFNPLKQKYVLDGENGGLMNAQYDTLEQAKARALQGSEYKHSGRQVFRGGHFDEPNVLAHVRFNDRTDADGNKVLFLEELQSDWHQKGRKQGYQVPEDATREQEALEKAQAARQKAAELVKKADALGFDSTGQALNYIARGELHFDDIDETGLPGLRDAAEEYHRASQEYQRILDSKTQGVPDAPFKKDWQELALRRMLRYAAENGYDKVAWTTGEQQAERYDLSKHIDSLDWIKEKDGRFSIAANKDGREVFAKASVAPEQLADYVGKDVAEKVINGEGKNYRMQGTYDMGSLSGLDLKVGGSGMKGFYDKIIPDYLNKYGKKFGAKVGKTTIGELELKANGLPEGWTVTDRGEGWRAGDRFAVHDENGAFVRGSNTEAQALENARGWIKANEPSVKTDVHSLEITPELRKAVMEGQPLFQQGDTVKGATQFMADGKAIVSLYNSADFSTFAHESFHVMRPHLKPEDMGILEREFGVKDGKWTTEHEETAARSWERYLRDGEAPSPKLADVFAKIKAWMVGIYQHLAGTELAKNVSPAVREVFDRMLGKEDSVSAETGEQPRPVDPNQEVMFQRRKRAETPPSGLLPGMEDVPEERKQAAAEAEGETLTGELTQPKGDISRAAGEMEQKSPLFRGTEASPQNEMFGDEGQTKLFSGIPPPEEFVKQFRTVFPSVAKRFDNWVSDERTVGGEQKATMRQTRGEMDRSLSVVAEKLKSYKKEWVSRPREDFRKFAQAVEGLIPVQDLAPRDQELANIFKSGFDEIRSQIQALKPEVLQSYIEHYFPHIWERPGVAEKAVRNVLASKRPFAGSERFRQKRTVPTIEDGLDLGLKPVSWNPVDMFLLKYKEEAQFLMAHKTLDMMKDNGNAKFVRINQASPEGWVKLDDRIGTVYGKEQVQTVEPGQDELYDEGGKPRQFTVIRGHYWAPPEAAKVFNNFVSRGFAGRYTTYDLAQGLNSNLNALQLGISAFHATTTSVNAATSDIALGLQQIRQGKVVEGATRVGAGVSTIPSIANTLRNGTKLMKEYLTPNSYEKFSREANAVEQAGGRAKQQTIQLHAFDEFMNAIKNRAYGDAAKAAPSAIIEASVWPVMEYYVPRMKFGAFYNMAHDILDRADRENWPEERTRARMQKAWDSIDNRFGQMVYDNLFWKKSLRDSLQLATRSVGWNYGTIRELGGAVPDLIKETARVGKGEAPEISDRVAFAFALAGYTAMIGGTMTYLMTGKRPQTWKDYYYPRQADGTRMSIPGYMKDVVSYLHDPKQTVMNKMGPLIELTAEAIQNRDFYGTEIRHKDDPVVKQLWQFAKFVGNTAMPFSISGSKKLVQKAGGDTSSFKETVKSGLRHPGQILAGQLGFQPAPAFIQHSPALNKAYEYEFTNRPPGVRTQAQADHHQYMRQMEDMFRSGKVDQKTIDSLISNHQITQADVRKAKVVSRLDPLAWAAFSLTLEQALNVYKDADDHEKKILKPIIIKKRTQISKEPDPDKRAELMRSYLQTVHPQGK